MKRFTEVDAERLEVHLEAGKRIRSFKPDYGGSICEAPSEQKIDQALEFYEGQNPFVPHGGIVQQQSKKKASRKYLMSQQKAGDEALPRHTWLELLKRHERYEMRKTNPMKPDDWLALHRSVKDFDRDLRALSRNAKIRQAFTMKAFVQQFKSNRHKLLAMRLVT